MGDISLSLSESTGNANEFGAIALEIGLAELVRGLRQESCEQTGQRPLALAANSVDIASHRDFTSVDSSTSHVAADALKLLPAFISVPDETIVCLAIVQHLDLVATTDLV